MSAGTRPGEGDVIRKAFLLTAPECLAIGRYVHRGAGTVVERDQHKLAIDPLRIDRLDDVTSRLWTDDDL